MGRKPNTVKSNLVSKLLDISEQDPDLQFDNSDFQDELDSTVLVRERVRGTKLQGAFDKKTGRKIKESAHTITLLPEGSRNQKPTQNGTWPSQLENKKKNSKRQTSLKRKRRKEQYSTRLQNQKPQKTKWRKRRNTRKNPGPP